MNAISIRIRSSVLTVSFITPKCLMNTASSFTMGEPHSWPSRSVPGVAQSCLSQSATGGLMSWRHWGSTTRQSRTSHRNTGVESGIVPDGLKPSAGAHRAGSVQKRQVDCIPLSGITISGHKFASEQSGRRPPSAVTEHKPPQPIPPENTETAPRHRPARSRPGELPRCAAR